MQKYQKLHLFDVDIENGPKLKESDSVEKGMDILPPFDTSVGRVGLTICFDVSPATFISHSQTSYSSKDFSCAFQRSLELLHGRTVRLDVTQLVYMLSYRIPLRLSPIRPLSQYQLDRHTGSLCLELVPLNRNRML